MNSLSIAPPCEFLRGVSPLVERGFRIDCHQSADSLRLPGAIVPTTSPRRFASRSRQPWSLAASSNGAAIAAVGPTGLDPSTPPQRRKAPVKEVVLVDPLVAKRIAEEDFVRRQKDAAKQRQREVEAINGGWAAVGLVGGFVVESITGQGILAQVASYLDGVATFFDQLAEAGVSAAGPF
eukprot:TRINITY_DN6706_c0_g1_i1.p1 TRINITY_DN6706_c0_g1~~TRINITY_DN6706_c0_g1_i1.p1  ORF type:complete len:180 (-),score=22.05 TRINITY_DN6706_c0_g1_i1:609-1148(-)